MTFKPNWYEVQLENKWKILARQKRFFMWALYSCIGCVMVGFDFGVAGTATALPAFQKQFGIPYPSRPSGYLVPANYQSGWSGASTGGDFLGVIIAGQLVEIIGRKYTVLIGCIVTAIGVGMQVGSHEWILFLCGRLVNAVGFGMLFLEAPVWIGENGRPELRGFFLCLANGSIVLGQFILSCVARGTSEIAGYWSYQSLIVLQFAPVVAMLMFYPWYPESAYWLVSKGRLDEAKQSLKRIHGDDDQDLLDAEFARIQEMHNQAQELAQQASASGPAFIQCLKGKNLKRTLIAILPILAQQFVGAAFVLGYIVYFLSLLGVSDFFTVSLILYIVMLLSNIVAFFSIEVFGRRIILVPGLSLLTGFLLIMGIMGCITSKAALWIILVCIFLWAIVYQISVGAVGWAIGSEVPSLPLRASTQSYVMVAGCVVGWLVGFISPYMINPDAGNLGAKVGFVFAGMTLPFCILFYFFVPETKGLTFSEMDYLFNNNVSCRKFQEVIKEHRDRSDTERSIGGDGTEKAETEARVVETTAP